MSINLPKKNDVSLLNDYYQQPDDSFSHLSCELKNVDKRIRFEEWLINDFSPEAAINTDLAWHSKVITMLATNLEETESKEEGQLNEDLLLAKLISKGSSLAKKDEGILAKGARLVQRSAGMFLNAISHTLKDTYLSFICTVLLRGMIEHKDVPKVLDQILEQSINHNNIAIIKAILELYPKQFKAAIDRLGTIPRRGLLELTLINNHVEIAKLVLESMPQEMFFSMLIDSMFIVKDDLREPLIVNAEARSSIEKMKLLAELHPDAFGKALILQDKYGCTPVYIAICVRNSLEIVKFLAEVANKEFQQALTMQGPKGLNPLHGLASACDNSLEACENSLEIMKFLEETAPNAFRKALTLKNHRGETPVHRACDNYKILKLIHKIAPDEFKKSLLLQDDHGNFPIDFIKRFRPYNYREITQLFKKSLASLLNKEAVKRRALAHAWDISATSKLVDLDTIIPIDLLGQWRSNAWFHMLSKDLGQFKVAYPDMLSETQLITLKEVLHISANPATFSLEDTFERIKDGLPTFITTGYTGHDVQLLIWNDQFVICNRGSASRKPVEFFHFDPKKLDVTDLEKIQPRFHNKDSYEKLFFEELHSKLGLKQTAQDLKLEENSNLLPYQTVGNCSFVSPITAIYALRILTEMQEVDLQKRKLLDEMPDQSILEQKIKAASNWYQKWLSFEQMIVLERNIRSHADDEFCLEPDHALIREVLRKAYMLPLDEVCSKKLEELTQIYLNSLNEKQQTVLKSDLIYWKSLS